METEYSFQTGPYTITGQLIICKCGRKIHVDAATCMARTIPDVNAVCLDCIELSKEFRSDHPDVASLIDEWKKA